MTCSCPKCHGQIEIDLSNIPESGTLTPCPECKIRFWVNKETYARRALIKEGNIYCDKCGNELEHKIVCKACGVMYPDYYLVQASKPPRRQVEKPELFSLSFTLKPSTPTYAYTYTYTGAKESSERTPKVLLKRVGLLALVALLAVGIAYLYHINQVEKQYAKNYMRALYTIKTGTDLSLNTCAKISAEWKTKMDAGQSFVPRISLEDESRLNMVKTATDGFMQKLNETPKKYINSKEKLANLYGVYTKVHALAVAPSGSLSGFTDSATKSGSEFNVVVKDLKASMPTGLSEELQVAKVKYKGLKDI
jgi:uncharacterized protein YbaR (Trm112 family)